MNFALRFLGSVVFLTYFFAVILCLRNSDPLASIFSNDLYVYANDVFFNRYLPIFGVGFAFAYSYYRKEKRGLE
jgi:hypothetical protein